jgi:drug/metabolite transporter (DMT)-like permease
MNKHQKAIFYALLAALLYAISSPLSKMLLNKIHPALLASLLYLGAGIGLSIIALIQRSFFKDNNQEKHLTKKELPFIVGMVLLDVLAPILMMIGLNLTTAANASLLNNFEIVATSIIALFFFKEKISSKLWFAIFLVTISSVILSIEDVSSFSFSLGSLFVLLASTSWGLENNFTRRLSSKNPLQIVIIKGFGAGFGSLLVSSLVGDHFVDPQYIFMALVVGFLAYGLSIFFYVYAQRNLGASRTSAYYAFAPFLGTAISLIIFKQIPSVIFIGAFMIMLIGAYLVYREPTRSIDHIDP